MANGLLMVAFDFSGAATDEFHDWYDLEHIPEREAVAGFGACERWIDVSNPTQAVATYDLAQLAVLESDAYQAISHDNLSPWSKRIGVQCNRLLRFEGVQVTPGNTPAPANAGGLLMNAMNVTAEADADFNAWYDEEHLPALASVPGVLSARRFVSSDATDATHRYAAIYHLESADVAASDAWLKAADTPWSAKVRPHFRNRIRILCSRYARAST
ncbi:MAG: hypothetical protein HOI95_05630 [Chromatiales bacterium]|jgi:hypothetical protein|nr:hypothetical protein [Chromatiales bacterium]